MPEHPDASGFGDFTVEVGRALRLVASARLRSGSRIDSRNVDFVIRYENCSMWLIIALLGARKTVLWQRERVLAFVTALIWIDLAVEAFQKPDSICTHVLDNPVSETLYLCVSGFRALPKRMETVIAETRQWL